MTTRLTATLFTVVAATATGCFDTSSLSDPDATTPMGTGDGAEMGGGAVSDTDADDAPTPDDGTDPSPDGGQESGGDCPPASTMCCGDDVCLIDCGQVGAVEQTCDYGCAAGACVPPTDGDGDGVPDLADNCPLDANADQANSDDDTAGDVCDDDDDNDGYVDATDCGPFDPAVYPDALEVCNAVDDDCDGDTDPPDAEGCQVRYVDSDLDGAGGTDSICTCEAAAPYTATAADDCNDEDASIHPDAEERCNGTDDDCDASVDEGFAGLGDACDGGDADLCLDGAIVCNADGSATVCDDGAATPGGTELCNGADDDCDGAVDETWAVQLGTPCDGPDADQCLGGEWVCNGAGTGLTCVGDANIAEICDGFDNDCDGSIDEGCDDDNDDYCDAGMTVSGNPATCNPLLGEDCNDGSSAINPGAAEQCNGYDDNCNGVVDGDEPSTSWPAADSHEPNNVFIIADEIFENVDAQIAFGPSDTSFSSVGDLDYYFWDDFSGQLPPPFMLCRVEGMTPQMRVDVYLAYRRSGDPQLPYTYSSTTWDDVATDSTVWLSVTSPTIGADEYEFVVGVIPSAGIDACDADYQLQCRMSYVNLW